MASDSLTTPQDFEVEGFDTSNAVGRSALEQEAQDFITDGYHMLEQSRPDDSPSEIVLVGNMTLRLQEMDGSSARHVYEAALFALFKWARTQD